jgi:hypothetical protein
MEWVWLWGKEGEKKILGRGERGEGERERERERDVRWVRAQCETSAEGTTGPPLCRRMDGSLFSRRGNCGCRHDDDLMLVWGRWCERAEDSQEEGLTRRAAKEAKERATVARSAEGKGGKTTTTATTTTATATRKRRERCGERECVCECVREIVIEKIEWEIEANQVDSQQRESV